MAALYNEGFCCRSIAKGIIQNVNAGFNKQIFRDLWVFSTDKAIPQIRDKKDVQKIQ